jgi:hypothetical protein
MLKEFDMRAPRWRCAATAARQIFYRKSSGKPGAAVNDIETHSHQHWPLENVTRTPRGLSDLTAGVALSTFFRQRPFGNTNSINRRNPESLVEHRARQAATA